MTAQEKGRADSRGNAAGFAKPFGLCDPACEHDGCGTGFIARLDGTPDHALVEDAVKILVNLEHRGAIGGDKATGDGAGLLLQTPDGFFRRAAADSGFDLPPRGGYAVASLFLPTDRGVRERCEAAFERTGEGEGLRAPPRILL